MCAPPPSRRVGVPPRAPATTPDIRHSTHGALVVVQHQGSLQEVSQRIDLLLAKQLLEQGEDLPSPRRHFLLIEMFLLNFDPRF